MRCLWITRQDPRSADSGDLIYTLGLLRAVTGTGRAEITALAHANGAVHDEIPGISFHLPAAVPPKSPLSLLSHLPSDAHRLGKPEMRAALRELLGTSSFDAAVIDQAACGWALDELPASLPVMYLAHNHEAVVRREVAAENDGPLPWRLALRRDAAQYARLERALCRRSQLISAITPRDEAAFRAEFPDKDYVHLSPGYSHEIPDAPPSPLVPDSPRRVVLAGTFEWLAKRRNLESFLEAAADVFPENGIDFQVVGKSAPDYFPALARRFPWAKFDANVPSIDPFLRDARMGLIPEALGGGFKLKALDYIFRGLPLAAVEPALSGLPLDPATDVIAADSPRSLAQAVADRIDDIDFLNRAARTSLDRCRDAFRWSDRGERLAEALTRLAVS